MTEHWELLRSLGLDGVAAALDELSVPLRDRHRDLYDALSRLFSLDPAAW